MKKLYAFLLTSLFLVPLSAQRWVDMIDSNQNFYQIQQEFYNYYGNGGYKKGKGWKQFKRWEHFMEPRVYPSGNLPNPTAAWKENQRMLNQYPNMRTSSTTWTPLGPANWNAAGSWNPGNGRVNAVTEDPNNSSIIYVGVPSGGLWKSTDAGATWTVLTDDQTVLGVSGIVVDHSNSNTIYIATGDGDGSDTYSVGVLKSTDGGATWNTTGLNWNVTQFRTTRKLLQHPTNANTLFVATTAGLYRTTDAGVTWSQVQSGSMRDVEFHPTNSNIVYASSDEFFKSTDGGASFTKITSGLPSASNINRFSIGVSANQPNSVYILGGDQGDSSFEGLYKSTNSGTSFAQQSSSPNIFSYETDGSGTGGQSWYDMALAVNPTNGDEIYVGGINVWKSTDGGVSWTITSHWVYPSSIGYTHADIHTLDYIGNTLYCGSDGGIFKSTDNAGTWTDLSAGLEIMQFYRLGGTQQNANILITGAQDNGTNLYKNGTWNGELGADGMEAAVDPHNTNILYGCIQNGSLRRTTDGGGNWSNIVNNINETGAWVTPYAVDPNNANRLYVALKNLWYSDDGGSNWTQMTSFTSSKLRNLAIAPSNSDYIYTGTYTSIHRTTDGGATWTDISNGLPSSSVRYITVHPTNPLKIWAAISGYNSNTVYTSDDGGTTWTNYSTGLPQLPANCVAVDKNGANTLYVGLDVGVYYRDNTMSSWLPYLSGLPNVIVNELEIHYPTKKLRAATYGRGMWEVDLVTGGLSNPPSLTCTNTINTYPYSESFENGLGNWIQNTTDNFDWTNQSGGTSTANTGPSSANNGTSYLYAEASSPNDEGQVTYLESPCFDLTPITSCNYSFSFDYHMSGSQMGSLNIQVTTDGTNWTTIWSVIGDQGTAWNTANINLADYSTKTIQLRFIAVTGVGELSDIAIDNINFSNSTASAGESPGTAIVAPSAGTYTTNGPSSGGGCLNCVSATHADWWVFTAPSTGTIDVESCGGGEDTRLWVYEGTCDNLTQIAANDDDCIMSPGSQPYASRVQNVPVTGGTSYYLEWDDRWSTDGFDFTINFTSSCDVTSAHTSTNVSCNGGNDGTINLTASNGSGNYTYAWDNSATTANLTGLSANTYIVTITDVTNTCSIFDTVIISEPTAIVTTDAITNVSCNGSASGAIDLTTTGGAGNYTFSWSNNATTEDITNLMAGTYTCTITDADNCTVTTSAYTVTEPIALTTAETHTNANCNGTNTGSIDLTVTGGTSGYTYLWSNNATTQDLNNIGAGTYTCTITDANNCTVTTTAISITEPMAIGGTGMVTNTACSGVATGAIDLTPTGGTAPYTYLWSNNTTTEDLTNIVAGSYTCTITDANNCTFTTTAFNVTNQSTVSSTGTTTNVACHGSSTGAINITPTGGTAPYTYLWSNNATTEDLTGLAANTYTVTITDVNNCTATQSFSITEPAVFALSEVVTNVSCNGSNDGAVNLTITGGTGSYSYAWSNNATTEDLSNLTPGTYTCTITDANNCTVTTAAINVTEPALLTATETLSNISCNAGNDGAITLSVTGGTPNASGNYTYAWSNNATTQNLTNVPAGNYTVTITDVNNCTFTNTYTLTAPPMLAYNENITNVSCNGGNDGSITIVVSGGTMPYTYQWTGGGSGASVNSLVAGNYGCTITDANNCVITTTTITVTEPTAIAATSSLTMVSCNGLNDGAIDLSVNGGAGNYTYSWNNNATTEDITGLTPNTYTVTITDADNCMQTESYTITEPNALILADTTVVHETQPGMNGSINAIINGGTAPYTYAWSNASTANPITGLIAGDYSCTVTDANGCQTFIGPFTISNFTNTTNITSLDDLKVFPNPTSDFVTVDLRLNELQEVRLEVFDVAGKQIMDSGYSQFQVKQYGLDMSNYASGVYLIKLTIGTGVLTRKVSVVR